MKGTLLLVPLPGRAYKVAVDGRSLTPVARGHVLEVALSQGARHVRIEDDQGGSIEHDLVIKNAAHPLPPGIRGGERADVEARLCRGRGPSSRAGARLAPRRGSRLLLTR
jgi:hypothetical protein